MKKIVYIPLLLLLLVIAPAAYHLQESREWNGKKCAVVLTYDDALNVHLDTVLPQLNKYNLKGTFYLVGNAPALTNRINEWRKAAKEGHELGNHTLNHPCDGSLPGRAWVSKDANLAKYTVKRAIDEIKVTNAFLKAIDGKDKRTFAYPCGDLKINDTLFYNSLKNEFSGARGVVSAYAGAKDINLDNIYCFGQSDTTAEQMIAQIKEAERKSSLIVLLFHGVGGEHPLNVSAKEHEKVLRYLNSRKKDIWVAPMVTVADYIKKLQTAK